jgi:hypothetical protein
MTNPNRQQSLESARNAVQFLRENVEWQIVDERIRAEIACLLDEFERMDADQTDRERWLNGWHRHGDSILIGTGYHCAGCGKFLGLGCVALDGEPWPEKLPDFPFEEATCPLCENRRTPNPPDQVDKLTERLERLRKVKK